LHPYNILQEHFSHKRLNTMQRITSQRADSGLSSVLEIARFELKNRIYSKATYLYFTAFFGLGFLAINLLTGLKATHVSIEIPGMEYANAPFTVMTVLAIFSAQGLVFAAGIFSQATCKDFETKFANILFSFPIAEWQYVVGRLIAAVAVTLFILLGLGIGYLVGEWMPWLDQEKLLAFNGWIYLHPYFYIIIPNILIFGGLFFGVGLLTRQTLIVYLTGIALFAGGNICNGIFNQSASWLANLLDPTGISALVSITKYWSPAQLASEFIPLSSDLITNRLLWFLLSGVFLGWSLSRFHFSQLATTSKRHSRKTQPLEQLQESILPTALIAPTQVHQSFNWIDQLSLLGNQTLIEFQTLLKNRWFLAALLIAIFPSMVVAGGRTKELYNTPMLPLTHLLVQEAASLYADLFKLLIIFLGGEMVWRDRTTRINQITDTLPIRTYVSLLSKLGALALVVVSTLLIILVSGVTVQTFLGYHRYEFGVYFTLLFTKLFPELLLMCALSFFLQVLVQNRYLGYFLAALVLFGLPALGKFLPQIPKVFIYGSFPESDYSQFDGFGATLAPLRWFQAYWSAWAILLLVFALLFWQRGVDTSFKQRWHIAQQRFTRPVQGLMLGSLAVVVGLGSWIYYNTRILNPVLSKQDVEKSQVEYEQQFKLYEAVQPQTTDINLKLDLYPEKQQLIARGNYILKNKTQTPVSKVLVRLPLVNGVTVQKLSLGKVAQPTSKKTLALEPKNLTTVYTFTLPKPLLPGQTTTLDFAVEWQPRGFQEQQQSTDIIANGTNFESRFLPQVGYLERVELKEKELRRKYNLPKSFSELSLSEQLLHPDKIQEPELVSVKAIVSTSVEQIAVVPGYLQREWIEGNRRYFEYRTSESIWNFFALYSANYEVKREKWKDVNLEIYYLKGHEYNGDRIMKAMKTSLDYFSTNFSPYQFKQARIFEFPRGQYAVSFPNTIGFSEFLGFLPRIEDNNPEGVDYTSLVTAHEIAHQWWGHQLVPAIGIKGQPMMNEVMAQYSALMVMEKLYGTQKIRHILKQELNAYLEGRSQAKEEQPLISSDTSHVYYRKGAMAIYALKDYIGEEALNQALAAYLQQHSKYSQNVPPYPTVVDLVSYLREATPPHLQYLITDLFETITLYNNRTLSAITTKRPDGKYEVKLTASAQKLRSDEKGNTKVIPMDEMIDIGILGKNGEIIYRQKHQLKSGENTITVVVDKEPDLAGVDPLNTLVNRVLGINLIKVNQQ